MKEQQEKQEHAETESKDEEKERKPAARSREKGTHVGTPIVRDREHWGAKEIHTEEEGTNTTREKQETQGTTEPTDGADGTHTHAYHQTHTHHPRRGSGDRRREGKERSIGGVRNEGRKGRLDLVRKNRKRKQRGEQPTPPKLQRERDETIGPRTGHSPTQSPSGHSWDPAIKRD